MDEIERMISVILGRHDLSTPEGRDAAYEDCIEFAESELSHDIRCNTFLRRVAEMLEKEAVEYEIIREMVDMPDDAMLDFAYDERHGFVITGNASGISYLADLLHILAEAPSGEHIHLYNDEEPITPTSFNAVIYVDEDEWFRKLAEETGEKGENGENLSRRNINPEDIFALQIVGDIPHDLTLTRDQLYRVDGIHNGEHEGAWKKSFSRDSDRYVTFRITDDHDEDLEITLHLDDPDINFFKKSDLAGLLD